MTKTATLETTTDPEPSYTIEGEPCYSVSAAARYLGMTFQVFLYHAKRNPTGLPSYTVKANGRRYWARTTLDRYRAEWLTPQPA